MILAGFSEPFLESCTGGGGFVVGAADGIGRFVVGSAGRRSESRLVGDNHPFFAFAEQADPYAVQLHNLLSGRR